MAYACATFNSEYISLSRNLRGMCFILKQSNFLQYLSEYLVNFITYQQNIISIKIMILNINKNIDTSV